MACWFEYNGKRYEPDELVDALKAMSPVEAAKHIPGIKPIPDAPFQKSWHELALKDAIREAAEKGFDRVSWTPGEAQAARYDLSKQVDRVLYSPEGHMLQAYKDGKLVIEKSGVEPKDLPDVIGKEAADKIVNNPTKKTNLGGKANQHELSGLDLKVGGEGMKGFYDKIIPDAMNKIGKPHGVKVERGELPGKKYTIREQPITGEVGGPRNVYDVLEPDGHLNSSFHTKEAAQAHIDAKNAATKQPVHYMDIPPSLKEQALKKGFSLFEDSATAGAPLSALEKTKKAEGGAVGDDYNTPLNPAEEMAFQAWKKLNAPNDSGRDYDLRGASQANMQRDPASGHFFDQFKKPNHPTFSDQSQYATGALRRQAGTWTGDAYAPPSPMARGGPVAATLRAHRSRNTP